MSDLIDRQAAIEALTKDKKALEHIINGMSGYEKEFDRFVGQRNQVDYDIYAIEQLPPAQPAPSQVAADIARIVENGKDMRVIEAAQPTPDQNGDLWITVPDIDKVTRIYVQENKSKFCRIFYEEQEQPEPYKGVTE